MTQWVLTTLVLLLGMNHAAAGGSAPRFQTVTWPGGVNATLDLRMPGSTPSRSNSYLHSAFKLPDMELYIIKFDALTTIDITHHMLIYGCTEPGGRGIWEGSPCGGYSSRILFAWAKNAPPFVVPSGVGARVGKGTTTRYLVIQIHYKDPIPANQPDHSGMAFTMSQVKPQYISGVYLHVGGGGIPAHKTAFHVDVSCTFTGSAPIHGFATRVHAHSLATVISGYRYNGTWTQIAKGNPQWPQAFYPIKPITIKAGDETFARCTYNSTSRDRTTYMGATDDDEMCNLYLMYYTDSKHGKDYKICGANNLPERMKDLPKDADVPLPPNPELDAMAHGHHHHAMGGHDEKTDSPPGSTSVPKSGSGTPTDSNGALPEITQVTNWPNLDGRRLGQIGGVATDKDGLVYIFHRGEVIWKYFSFDALNNYKASAFPPVQANPILVLTAQGRIHREWGNNTYYMPHGITVDDKNNIWLTDVALHQVFRIPAGKEIPDLILGTSLKPGKSKTKFCKPADVAVLENGDFFVADGYCNNRVVKFDKNGNYIREWGKYNSPRGFSHQPTTYAIVHSVTIAPDKGVVCVVDREDGLIQCFDYDGNFKKEIKSADKIGDKLYAIEYCPQHGGLLFAVNGESRGVPVQGLVIDYETGQIIGDFSPKSGPFKTPHDIAVDSARHSIYVGDIAQKMEVYKFSMPSVVQTKPPSLSTALPPVVPSFKPKWIEHAKIIHHISDIISGAHVEKSTSKLPTTQTTSPTKPTTTPESLITPGDINHLQEMNATSVKHDAGTSRRISIIIACLLVIPISVLILASVVVKTYKDGGFCCQRRALKSRVFNLGTLNYFNSHKGFNKVATEDSDHEIDPLHDSDEEYSAPRFNSHSKM